MRGLRVVVGLGAIGTRAAGQALVAAGYAFGRKPSFHGTEARAAHAQRSPVVLLPSYHPSRQNTNTVRADEEMLDAIFARARHVCAHASAQSSHRYESRIDSDGS